MELIDLRNHIKDKTLPHFLILFGDEQCILDTYIDIISKNYTKIECQSVIFALNKVNMKSLDKSKKAYIINEDLDFIKNEKAWKTIKNTFNNKKDLLILKYHKLDKRNKFYTGNKSNAVEFNYLTNDILINYVLKELPNLNDTNCDKLINYCNNDYGRILLECDKIKQYSNFNKKDNNESFEILDKQGIFFKEIGDITFELTDAILGGYSDKAIIKLNEAKQKGEPAIMIASILYNGFRNQLAYQSVGINKKGVCEKTGLTKGEAYGCSKLVGGYSIKELIRNLGICQFVESGIKLGKIDDSIALDYLVVKCLS